MWCSNSRLRWLYNEITWWSVIQWRLIYFNVNSRLYLNCSLRRRLHFCICKSYNIHAYTTRCSQWDFGATMRWFVIEGWGGLAKMDQWEAWKRCKHKKRGQKGFFGRGVDLKPWKVTVRMSLLGCTSVKYWNCSRLLNPMQLLYMFNFLCVQTNIR